MLTAKTFTIAEDPSFLEFALCPACLCCYDEEKAGTACEAPALFENALAEDT
jgi:hypothetical protein